MKILQNLENAAAAVKAAQTMIEKVKKDSLSAQHPKLYINENRNKIIETLKKDLQQNTTERKKVLLENIRTAQGRLEAYTKPSKTGMENVHYMRAERITRAQTVEETLATYKRNVGRLGEAERKDLRWIYDDALHEAIAMIQPEAAFMAEGAIEDFMGEPEKGYREQVKLEYQMLEQLKCVDGLIEGQAEALAAGEEPVEYSWPKVIVESLGNAKRNVRGPDPMPEIRVNPYEEEAAEASEEAPTE